MQELTRGGTGVEHGDIPLPNKGRLWGVSMDERKVILGITFL